MYRKHVATDYLLKFGTNRLDRLGCGDEHRLKICYFYGFSSSFNFTVSIALT